MYQRSLQTENARALTTTTSSLSHISETSTDRTIRSTTWLFTARLSQTVHMYPHSSSLSRRIVSLSIRTSFSATATAWHHRYRERVHRQVRTYLTERYSYIIQERHSPELQPTLWITSMSMTRRYSLFSRAVS